MTSQIYLTATDWTELATGACVISARGAADITFAAALPPADAPAHGLISTSDTLDYTGPDKAWGRAREPGSFVVVSGAVVQPDLGPVQAVAPLVTGQPALTPSAPDVGEDVTVNPGTATGTPALDAEIELSVAGIRVATDVTPIRFPRPGAWELKVTWRNGTAPNAIAAVTGTVTAVASSSGNPSQSANSFTATPADFSRDLLDFDIGAAVGRNAARVPVSGTTDAPVDSVIELRAWSPTTQTAWVPVTVTSPGVWSGVVNVPGGFELYQVEARVQNSDQPETRATTRFRGAYVIGLLGQSEIFRAINITASPRIYQGDLSNPERVRMVKGNPVPGGGGQPVTSYSVTGPFDLSSTPVASSIMTHAADMVRRNIAIPVTFVEMSIPGTGRTDLSSDASNLRRWQDLVAKLDAAGYQDGARPGLIVESWTNADAIMAGNFVDVFKPFYCGLNADGSDYVLGTPIVAQNFGVIGTATHTHDHCLFDLSGQDRGLFDPADTRILVCQHRFDPVAVDRQNAYVRADSGSVEIEMIQQEVIRETDFPAMLADPDLSQILLPGLDLMSYENGFLNNTVWIDQIHPGSGPDGLPLFARLLAWAGLFGVGEVGSAQPEFDQVTFDPAGGFADFASSAGNVTTTRKLRGLADPAVDPGPHWTDVLGFEFQGQPVERAEIQPDGSVRVYVPPALAPADWSRQRFGFGRGGGTGLLLNSDDPKEGAWMNYPVIDAAALGVGGLFDDQVESAGGVPLRALANAPQLAHASYRAAAVNVPAGVWFEDPSAGPGAGVAQLRIDLRAAFSPWAVDLWLFGAGTRIPVVVNKALGTRIGPLWGGGGSLDASSKPILPGVRHDLSFRLDMVANTADLTVDGNPFMSFAVGGDAGCVAALNAGFPDGQFDRWPDAFRGRV